MARQRAAEGQLGGLGRRIDEWRARQPRRRAMPERLWAEAVRLAGEVGRYRVVCCTRLNHESLSRRLREARARKACGDGARLVELRGSDLLATGGSAGSVLELDAPDGTRLRLTLAAGQCLDLAAVVAAFGRRP